MSNQIQTASSNKSETPGAPMTLWVITTLLGALYLWQFWSSLVSMAEIWLRSDTYAHGMLVPCISLWLIWRKRQLLTSVSMQPSWLAVASVGLGALVWLVGVAVDISVLHQLAAVGILIALVPALFGLRLFLALLFPLLYLLFMVPFGEELTPALQQITAEITVQVLRLSGIPVYINGLFIEIPSGKFEVAEACSGIRYLIASLAVGTLYAYLTYQSTTKRALFITGSLLVPVLANGLRAYLIVLIAHLSDMQYATGVDHLIYGWLFFGLVMGLMFWVGSYWREPEHTRALSPSASSKSVASTTAAMILGLLFIALGVAERQLQAAPSTPPQADIYAPTIPGWIAINQTSTDLSDWQPEFIGADRSLQQRYQKDGMVIGFYRADYHWEGPDKELINHHNRINGADHWSLARRQTFDLNRANVQLPLIESELRHINGSKRRIWHSYHANGQFSNSPILVKLLQALNRFQATAWASSVFIVATDYQNEAQAEALAMFFHDAWPVIEAQLSTQRPSKEL